MRRVWPVPAALIAGLLVWLLVASREGGDPALPASPSSPRTPDRTAPPSSGPDVSPAPAALAGLVPDPPAREAPAETLARLHGVVWTKDGAPAAGAIVTLDPPGEEEGKPLSVSTDRDGRFSLPISRGGKGTLVNATSADLDERATVELPPLDLARLPEIEIHLETSASLRGRVVDSSGSPVAGALVRLVDLPGLSLERHEREREAGVVATDSEGRYRLGGVLPGAKRLIVEAAGHPQRWIDLAIEGLDEDRELDVELSPSAKLAGLVLDDAGRPLAGAILHFLRVETEAGDPGETRFARADGEGRFEVAGLDPTRDYAVRVFHPSLGETRALPSTVPGSAGWREFMVE
ncbi:MAG: carboxypeptidase regulatory-like domain-containing protein [Planctomycetes bacterium]|nr:carboxypeptidase regulatory-like domain-containing protein [Planctomycetota bacterium]